MNSHILNVFSINQESDIVVEKTELNALSLSQWVKALPSGRRLFLGIDNRNSLRYDCGDVPDGFAYTKAEIVALLKQIGISYKCYSIYPCLDYPQFVYADKILPNEELLVRYFPKYNHPEKVFEIEEFQIDGLIPKGEFHEKANAFLFECAWNDSFSDIEHITFSADRYREKAFATIIYSSKKVLVICFLGGFKDYLVHMMKRVYK